MSTIFNVGAATVDITPRNSQFLFGYPHVERYSTGVHDPLYSTALAIRNADTSLLYVANDVIFVSKALVARARARISRQTGIVPENIVISATHTHSGPITVDHASNKGDPIVPAASREFLGRLEDGIVAAGCAAVEQAVPATLAYAVADGSSVGTNRHDPGGTRNTSVPLLIARSTDGSPIAAMLVCAMHPTVLHEDSTLVSADFPGFARRRIREGIGREIPILHHTGPCGNLSPRHVTKANTFAEAERIGRSLGSAILSAWQSAEPIEQMTIGRLTAGVELVTRSLPAVDEAEARLQAARERYQELMHDPEATPQLRRSAEVDVFGAEETVTLATLQASGELDEFVAASMPAEIAVTTVGDVSFVAWPGEFFVEYALAIEREFPRTHVISMAGGELQGYIVTQEAVLAATYEAGNALFSAESGALVLNGTRALLRQLGAGSEDPRSAEEL